MDVVNERVKRDIWQAILALSPIMLVFFLVAFRQPLFTKIPLKNELSVITGTLETIEEQHASILTSDGYIKVTYECLCHYGWGEKAFDYGMVISALAQNTDDGYQLWQLVINQQTIFTYADIAMKKQQQVHSANLIAMPGIIISLVLLLQLVIQKIDDKKQLVDLAKLDDLFDRLADVSQSDSSRLDNLDEILSYQPFEIIGNLEVIGMFNNNSQLFSDRIGVELGLLWSEMAFEELQAIDYLQPAVKSAAMKVLQTKNRQWYQKLYKSGWLAAGA